MEAKKPEYLNDEEVRKLIQAPNLGTAAGVRNLALILLMLDGGCKVSELVGKENTETLVSGLRNGDIDWKKNVITINNEKKGTSRLIPIQQETKNAMLRWKELRPASNTDLFFISLKGKKIQNRYIREFLSTYARQEGIQKPVKPSILRHTYAKKLFEVSKNIELVRRRLGHINITSTALYALPEEVKP